MKKEYTLNEINKILSEDRENNYSCDYEDDYSLLESLDDYFIYNLIGICGCGDPDAMHFFIRDVLRIFDWRNDAFDARMDHETMWNESEKKFKNVFGVESIYDSPMSMFVIYILNNLGLLEHGGSIGGSWITELGRMCLTVLEKKCKEIEDELVDE